MRKRQIPIPASERPQNVSPGVNPGYRTNPNNQSPGWGDRSFRSGPPAAPYGGLWFTGVPTYPGLTPGATFLGPSGAGGVREWAQPIPLKNRSSPFANSA